MLPVDLFFRARAAPSCESEQEPHWCRCERIASGDNVELLVLSRTLDFSAFQVLRETYLPHVGIWLADYPFVKRGVFERISAEIEFARRVQQW